jgi:uncharacterized protein
MKSSRRIIRDYGHSMILKASIVSVVLVVMVVGLNCSTPAVQKDYPIQPVAFTQVQLKDNFWAPRIETNRRVTIPANFQKCEETGRINNFYVAGGLRDGEFQGIRYDDSDVFKVMEGAAYSLSTHPDPKLEQYMDELIAAIAAAQEDDGYLFTTRTIDPANPARVSGDTRWSLLKQSHELYNVGHMYEAAVAYYQATGKRNFLDVAIESADLICRLFNPDGIHDVPGHQEIEIGLSKLYRVTGNERFLETAKYFLDERGYTENRDSLEDYNQDHVPVIEQSEAVGHSVRAGYMYAGMTDVAALTDAPGYALALDRIWRNITEQKYYITGGIGASHKGEAFGPNYSLPHDAYNETCAAIAHVLFNHRMFLLHGDAEYLDVLERSLYNGVLAGYDLAGDKFFYPNPLVSDGETPFNKGAAVRQPWFRTSCCPSNICRIIPSIPGYVYARRGNRVYVNLYAAGSGAVDMYRGRVHLKQETKYPWDGDVAITVTPDSVKEFALHVRIPGWAQNQPVPSDLYAYRSINDDAVTITVNGQDVLVQTEQGFVVIEREWQAGDVVRLHLPMPVRQVVSHSAVDANSGLVSLERGPLVYCVEGADHDGTIANITVQDGMTFDVEHRSGMLGGITTISNETLTAIPYYAWCHRGANEMSVWLPRN